METMVAVVVVVCLTLIVLAEIAVRIVGILKEDKRK